MQTGADMGRIIAFGGGKGGIGKSFLISNTGALLAAVGKRVAIVDLDLGTPNLHTFFGVSSPETGLQDYLDRRVAELGDTVVSTRIPRVELITAKGCTTHVANLSLSGKLDILEGIKTLPHDIVLLDLGAGTHFNTLDFFLGASRGVVVTTPEPTAVENAFRFVHAVYFRELYRSLNEKTVRKLAERCMQDCPGSTVRPKDIVAALSATHPEAAKDLAQTLCDLRFDIAVNQSRTGFDLDIGKQLVSFYERFFYPSFTVSATIRHDSAVFDAVMAKDVFVFRNKQHPVTRQIMRLAKALLAP